MVDAQERLSERAKPLLQGRRTRSVGDELCLNTEATQSFPRKRSIGVRAYDRHELNGRAQAAGVRGHNPGAAQEFRVLDRRDDNCRIFLRHAERITIDIFINDEVADHEHAQRTEPSEHLGKLSECEAVSRRIVGRLANGREVRLKIFSSQKPKRDETNVSRAEHKLAVPVAEELLLVVLTLGVFVPFNDNIGPQRLDELNRVAFKAHNEVNIRKGGHAVDAQIGWQADAWIAIRINPDDKEVRLLMREFQQAKMAGMDDVEVAGNEGNSSFGARRLADRLDRLSIICGFVVHEGLTGGQEEAGAGARPVACLPLRFWASLCGRINALD